MTQGWQLRPAGLDDLAAIVEIIRVEDLKYRGRSDIELGVTRERIAADHGFDVERDQVVADLDGEVVAAAIINPRGAMIAIHPDHDLTHLRQDVLDWVERRQSEMGRGSVYVAVPAANTRATRFYLGCGYRLERFSGWRGRCCWAHLPRSTWRVFRAWSSTSLRTTLVLSISTSGWA